MVESITGYYFKKIPIWNDSYMMLYKMVSNKNMIMRSPIPLEGSLRSPSKPFPFGEGELKISEKGETKMIENYDMDEMF